jgi:hypothetical protein
VLAVLFTVVLAVMLVGVCANAIVAAAIADTAKTPVAIVAFFIICSPPPDINLL